MKIDSTKTPSLPFDTAIIEFHDKSLGKIDPTKIELYLDDAQKIGYIEGNKLREKLKDKPVLNATDELTKLDEEKRGYLYDAEEVDRALRVIEEMKDMEYVAKLLNSEYNRLHKLASDILLKMFPPK